MNKVMSEWPAILKQKGYAVSVDYFTDIEVQILEKEFDRLSKRCGDMSLGDKDNSLIFVHEKESKKLARYEAITSNSDLIREKIVTKLRTSIESIFGVSAPLLKDKCNLKYPGGGGFPPHQDYVAYKGFSNDAHITVMLPIDSFTRENGAIQFCSNYYEGAPDSTVYAKGILGDQPIYKTTGNGVIEEEVNKQLSYEKIFLDIGDVVFFNSYVPHWSPKNSSKFRRSAMFFTFALNGQENLYDVYYEQKREKPLDPKFHVATPTAYEY